MFADIDLIYILFLKRYNTISSGGKSTKRLYLSKSIAT